MKMNDMKFDDFEQFRSQLAGSDKSSNSTISTVPEVVYTIYCHCIENAIFRDGIPRMLGSSPSSPLRARCLESAAHIT
jgi:hypothetical protein